MIGAAVDVGSNSIHLLVARVTEAGLEPLVDVSELIGLGDVVDKRGLIPPESSSALVKTLLRYRDLAHESGAESVTFLGTEPLRRAANAADVAEAVFQETGLTLRILDEHEEGELTFLGVTRGLEVVYPLLVVDIGGGSTEVILFDPASGLQVFSLPTGSARLSREVVEHDPPTKHEVARLRSAATDLMSMLPAGAPARAIFVGGTATNLVRLRPLATSGFEQLYGTLRAAPAARIAQRFKLRLRRAHQLCAGAALAEALLKNYQLARAEVTQASLRDGAIVAAARSG